MTHFAPDKAYLNLSDVLTIEDYSCPLVRQSILHVHEHLGGTRNGRSSEPFKAQPGRGHNAARLPRKSKHEVSCALS